ncbi:hypothetical protein PoB_003162800 [Plakobranchus ocellatus]|uniref:Sulfatase N-terminal domain-containing protein n=1 Tax=Plakobranchus ocellatus TaxID=259542 RepID=A0AAV4ACX7_9GAST|nr:hypothetical protein PoB_003162800 [Plakobranchus ocellatus]
MAITHVLKPSFHKSFKAFSVILCFALLATFLSISFLTSSSLPRSLISLSTKSVNKTENLGLTERNATFLEADFKKSNQTENATAESKPAKRVQMCVHPKLSENDPVMMKFVKMPMMPTCTKEEWLVVHNGTVQFSSEALKKYKSFTCNYYPLKRESEKNSVFLEPIKNISSGFKMVTDFFKGECLSREGVNNTALYSGVHYSEDRARRYEKADPLKQGFEGLSIAILGFDSMSRMSWYRRLKKTRKYFYNDMEGIELKGHNIVGDGTTAVVLPMLTGKLEWELPECRKGSKRRPQTNCDEGHTSSRLWLSYFKDIFLMYPKQRKFLFHFITDFSHDDNNGILKMDDDIEKLIKFLHQNNYLNNTLLILMGDHGARYPNAVRSSWQGQMEERLPYFGLSFPPWFEAKYPQAIKNLRINTERLTTPFDIYETFKDFLYFKGTGEGDLFHRGISLFKEIPPERTCQHAGIAAHWCTCLDWKNVSVNDPGVQRAVRTVVDTLNKYTAAYRKDCALLSVLSVDMASTMQPKQEVLNFKSESYETWKVDLSGKVTNGLRLYQLMLTTQPGGGKFEVTISHNLIEDVMSVSEKEISRINKYGNDPACILQKNKQIRAYCYCKSNIKR